MIKTVCKVCGCEYEGDGRCPVCDYQEPGFYGEVSPKLKESFEELANNHRKVCMRPVKVYMTGYYWEDKEGKLVEKSRKEFLIGEQLDQVGLNQVAWADIVFGKQTAGEEKMIDITVETAKNGKKKTRLAVIAPDTEGIWKVGVVRKPGMMLAIRVGDDKVYFDTQEVSMK